MSEIARRYRSEPIAIVGLSGIFPGSTTVREFFRNALRKRCFVRELPDWQWERDIYFAEDRRAPLKIYSLLGALLGDLDMDLAPFRIPPATAVQMSRNQKLALLCSREALADAGYLDRDFDRERVGVFLAMRGGDLVETTLETIFTRRFRARMEKLAQDSVQKRLVAELWDAYEATYPTPPITEDTGPGQSGNLASGRVASAFDLHGLNMAVDSACASSLAAVAMGVGALRTGVCDMVITGGSYTDMGVGTYMTFAKVGALSGTGSFPFDERADGFVLGEGCGMFVLKRLADALRDHDRIYALIRGWGSSSDGAGKSITAPSSDGQLRALRRAYEDAGLAPGALHFIECHGTGTQVGDASELDAVRRLLLADGDETAHRAALPIGSAKAMAGHNQLAAGGAGLLRAILAINCRVVPPQVNFEHPTSAFDWGHSGLRVPTRPEPITADEVRVGVSGFGFGGTNFHIVLSSPPAKGREPLVAPEEYALAELPPLRSGIGFLFPGQGSQYVGMLESLRDDPAARLLLGQADEIVAEITGERLTNLIYPAATARDGAQELAQREAALRDTAVSQPAIFTISAILLEKVRELGIDCGLAIGHSLGEYTALYAAGILSFSDGVRAVTTRGQLMAALPAEDVGAMAVVSAGPERVTELLNEVGGYVVCANLNAYDQTVVSGETAAVDAVVRLAAQRGLQASRLNVQRAFHSRLVSPCVSPLRLALEELSFRSTTIPVPADVSRQVYPFSIDGAGQLMTGAERDRCLDLLCAQTECPVDFVSQIELAYEAGIRRFVEIGPRSVLTRLVHDMLQGKPFQAIALDQVGTDPRDTLAALHGALTSPLTIPRRPLPTRPPLILQANGGTGAGQSTTLSDRVRAVVAQVSGYDAAHIGEDVEFERDLGIDTLKIIEIVSRLRGAVLPNDFNAFRQATSVRKILAFAEAAAVRTEPPARQPAGPEPGGEIRCYRHEVVSLGSVARSGPDPREARWRVVIGPALTASGWSMPFSSRIASPESPDALVVWNLPASAEELCGRSIPGLLRCVLELADAARGAAREPEVHLVTLASADCFDAGSFRALSALAKSFQKDLPYLRFSYYHLDTLQPDEALLRRVLAEPVLGRRVRADDEWEEGRLVYLPGRGGDPQDLPELLGPEDVVLVTGGTRGITSRIVRSLLPMVQARFLLVGRTPPDWSAAEGQGRVDHLAADLCDAESVRALGLPGRGITLLIHAAGVVANRPLRRVQSAEMERILGVKVLGLHRVLEGLDLSRLRGIVGFSSIAGFGGGDGSPDYAAANAYLDGFVCGPVPVLSIGWSAWGEVGMATNATTRAFLERSGVQPISLGQGIETFGGLLASFLKEGGPRPRNVVVVAGTAEALFLKRDPFRIAMSAALLGESRATGGDSQATEIGPTWLPASTAPSLAAELRHASVKVDLALDGVVSIALQLPAAASYGQFHLDTLYTAAEREEIAATVPEKRRREKLAGKLAVKLLTLDVLERCLGAQCTPAAVQVLAAAGPVRASLPSEPDLDATLAGMFFSISHSGDLVCAAAARRPVGIDVETVRPLSEATVREICDDRLLRAIERYLGRLRNDEEGPVLKREALYVVAFTQKEAILKAAGVGIADGLADVDLTEFDLGRAFSATHRGARYQVLSIRQGEWAISLACLGEAERRSPSAAVARKEVVPSFGQEALWFDEKLEGIGSTYVVAWTQRLRGLLDVQALGQSLQYLVDRHEVLRTVFADVEGICRAEVLSTLPVDLPLVDLSAETRDRGLEEVERRCQVELRRGFDLATGPLLRALVFRLESADHVLLFVFHHMVIDTSSATFRRELGLCYRALAAGRLPELPPLPFQYGDFARRQRGLLTGERLAQLVSYWRAKLAGCPPLLDLRADRQRPAVQTFRSGSIPFAIPADIVLALRDLSKSEGVTVFVTFLAAYQVLLMRLSSQHDITVGAPFAGRDDTETYPLIGYFVNMLPLRTDLSGNPRFREILPGVRATVMEALEHQDLPFRKLVETLVPQRDGAYQPLFRTYIRLLHETAESDQTLGLNEEYREIPPGGTRFDLGLIVGIRGNGADCRLEFNRDLFTEATVRRLADCFLRLVESIAADADVRLAEIPLMTPAEEQQIVRTWNDTRTDYPRDLCVHQLFEVQVERAPQATALVWGSQQLTYRELNDRANRLAHYLRKLGVDPDVRVGLCLERSVDMIVAMVGILKAGAAYVPLDPSYPRERLDFMLQDARTSLVLTTEHFLGAIRTSDAQVLCVDRDWQQIAQESAGNPVNEARAASLAYVMYTSGSTGRPKGVAVPHRAVTRLVCNSDYVQLGPGDRVAQASNASFDAATFEVWGALLNGALLVAVPRDVVLSPLDLAAYILERKVDVLFLTTALFNQLAATIPEGFRTVRDLLFGGEAVDPRWVKAVLAKAPPRRLLHVYGPTESTTFATWHLVQDVDEEATTVPIGRPIANTQVYLLDGAMQPVPIGFPGELYIGGDGLARGYLNRPDLTSDRFVADPFCPEPGAMMYRTGDVARYLPDGNIEYLGRTDDQIKIRGFRVELAEIAAVLGQHPAVREVAILARLDRPGDKQLVGYVVTDSGSDVPVEDLRAFLKQKLPDYMIPSAWVRLDSLPLTPSGKVNRRALPAPISAEGGARRVSAAPADAVEAGLLRMWETLLGYGPVSVHDNFFESGGHSLLAIQLFTEIERSFGVRLPVSALFQSPTVAQLADVIRQGSDATLWATVVPIQSEGSRLPFFCVHSFDGGVLAYGELARLLGPEQPFFGLQAKGLDGREEPQTRIEEMAADYVRAIRSVQPSGPYCLGGYCYGGVVAFEMARQIQARGERVGLLALFEASIRTAGDGSVPWWYPAAAASFVGNLPLWLRDSLPDSKHKLLGRTVIRGRAKLRAVWRSVSGERNPPGAYVPLNDFLGDISHISEEGRRTLSARLEALEGYHPQVYQGQVTLFRTRALPLTLPHDPELGWGSLATCGVEIKIVAGNHDSILRKPHVESLAAQLQMCLAQVEASGKSL